MAPGAAHEEPQVRHDGATTRADGSACRPTLVARAVGLGPLHVLALQRTVGNVAVSRAVQQSALAPTSSLQRFGPPVVQRDDTDRQAKVDAAINAAVPDPAMVRDIDSFGGLPQGTLIKLARILVYHYWLFLGPRERGKLKDIFLAFGPMADLARLDPFLLEKCIKEWPGLMRDIPEIQAAAEDFPKRIMGDAQKNIGANVTYLDEQYKAMGGKDGADPKANLEDSQVQNQRAQAMVDIAARIQRIRNGQKKMLDQEVGFAYNDHNPIFPTRSVMFRPDKPPGNDWHSREGDDNKTWTTLSEQWEAAELLTGALAGQYPWLFGILKDPDSADAQLAKLVAAKDHPYEARVEIMGQMFHQKTLAEAAKKKLDGMSGDAWYDLAPIRKRLLNAETTDLDAFHLIVGRGVVGEREESEWWKKFGLEVAADAALVLVSFATAGAAPLIAGVVGAAVAAGIPATQAFSAYEKSKDLDDLHRATVLPGTDLVGAMQADIARAEAMAFAIEAVLNLVMGIAPLAADAGLTVELSRLSTMSGAQQAALIARAVGEKGGVYVAERSGLTLAELAGKVEPGSALAAKLEQEFLDIIAKRPTELSPAERGAIRDALATAASDANTAANGPDPAEDGDVDLKISQVPFITIELPKSGASVQPSVQRVNPYTLPKEFEEFSAQQLTAGIAPLPRMDLVIRGQYTGSDNGIDLIGLAIDEPGERFTLYHWECKFVLPGGSPKLGKRSDGTWIQTGNLWTRDNARLFLTSPYAQPARERLIKVATQHNGGRAVTEEMLYRKIVRAETGYIVPDYANIERMAATIRGIARWKRVLGIYRIPLPFSQK